MFSIPYRLGVLQSAAVILALNLLVQVGGRSQTVRLSDARTCTRAWLAFGPLGITHRLEGL
jgi:hypothetical protein